MTAAVYDALERLTATTESRLLALVKKLREGEITEQAFHAFAAALIERARTQGVSLADLSLSAYLTAATGTATPTLGLARPEADGERIREGLSTLLAALETEADPDYRVARYGRSEPATAFQDAFVDGLRLRDIPGYRRVLSPGACELCQWLYKDGHVYPADKAFHKHPGCLCTPAPVFEGGDPP